MKTPLTMRTLLIDVHFKLSRMALRMPDSISILPLQYKAFGNINAR